MRFYTYLWLREDGTPYYVGKGTGRRAFQTDDHRVKCPKDKSRILVQPHPTEDDALAAEKFFVDYYGRKDLGLGNLRNITNGGDRGPTGFHFSLEQRKRLSIAHKGLIRSKEHRQNLAIALKGKRASTETRRKQSDSAKRRLQTEEGRLNSSRAGKLGAAARWGKRES